MDIHAEKYALIEYITQVKDADIIAKIMEFVQATEYDFWNDLTEEQKQKIRQRMDELDRGEKSDYEDFMSRHR